MLSKSISDSSQLDAVYNKHQCTYVYSSHTTGDLMLIAVDQKDRTLARTYSLYILQPIASDALH